MAEADTSENADRLRYHLQALTSELGLGNGEPDKERPLRPVAPSIDQQRLMAAKAWVTASAAPGRVFEDESLFANPALSLLLDLYINHAAQRRVSVSSACIAAGVPPTTGLRWIERLFRAGYLERAADAADGRRALISISGSGLSRMNATLDAMIEGERRAGVARLQFVV